MEEKYYTLVEYQGNIARTTRPKAYSRIADRFIGFAYYTSGTIGSRSVEVEECGGIVIGAYRHLNQIEIKYTNKFYEDYITTRKKIFDRQREGEEDFE